MIDIQQFRFFLLDIGLFYCYRLLKLRDTEASEFGEYKNKDDILIFVE